MGPELRVARKILEDWAYWFDHSNGYPHRSSIESFNDGWGMNGGVFGSVIPRGVEPSKGIRRASVAIALLTEQKNGLAELIFAKYRKTRLVQNRELRMVITAELGFLSCYMAVGDE